MRPPFAYVKPQRGSDSGAAAAAVSGGQGAVTRPAEAFNEGGAALHQIKYLLGSANEREPHLKSGQPLLQRRETTENLNAISNVIIASLRRQHFVLCGLLSFIDGNRRKAVFLVCK